MPGEGRASRHPGGAPRVTELTALDENVPHDLGLSRGGSEHARLNRDAGADDQQVEVSLQ